MHAPFTHITPANPDLHFPARWEDLDLDDVDIRMKWAGLFHRGKRTPGKFMMRIRVSAWLRPHS